MPIPKNGSGVIIETPIINNDRFQRTGVIPDAHFALCDEVDVLKQIQFNASPLSTNSTITLQAPNGGSTATYVLPYERHDLESCEHRGVCARSGQPTIAPGATGDAVWRLELRAVHRVACAAKRTLG